jgi:hypothetical protein
MRAAALIMLSGIALATFPAASATLCPTLEGYPDCPYSGNSPRALYQGNLEPLRTTSALVRAASPAKSHRTARVTPGSTPTRK